MSAARTFLINASMLMSGTLLAQAITFGASFVLPRLYEPAEFGHYSIFAGCAGVLAVASTGALDRVILLGRSGEESRRAATTVFVLAACAAAIISLAGAALGILGLSSVVPLTVFDLGILIPIFVICYAGAQVFTYASLRHNRVHALASFRVAQSLTMAAVQMLASGFKSVPGLILGNIAGWLLLLFAGLRWRLGEGRMRADLQPRALGATIKRNWRYPRYIMPNDVLDGFSNQVPLFLVGTFLSLSTAGHYGLAIMMLSAPAAVVGQAVGQAFLQFMGLHGHEPQVLRRHMHRIWGGMALLGLAPFGIVLAFGPTVFGTAFGEGWREAGTIAQYLAVLLFLRFCSSPTSTVYLKLQMQRDQWRFCVAAALYRTGAYSLVAFGASLKSAILVHVILESTAIIAYNAAALRRLRLPVGRAVAIA